MRYGVTACPVGLDRDDAIYGSSEGAQTGYLDQPPEGERPGRCVGQARSGDQRLQYQGTIAGPHAEASMTSAAC